MTPRIVRTALLSAALASSSSSSSSSSSASASASSPRSSYSSVRRRGGELRRRVRGSRTCRIYRAYAQYAPSPSPSPSPSPMVGVGVGVGVVGPIQSAADGTWRCVAESTGMSYSVRLPASFVYENEDGLYGGGEYIEIGDFWYGEEMAAIYTDRSSSFRVVDDDGGRDRGGGRGRGGGGTRSLLANTRSRRDVLILRVTGLDPRGGEVGVSNSAAELSDAIFGTDGSDINLRSQLYGCSKRRVRLRDAGDAGGVLDVTIEVNVEGAERGAIENAATEAATSGLGGYLPSEVADFVIYCLPNTTTVGGGGSNPDGWLSEGYLNGDRALFNNSTCHDLTYLMREVGHGLGLARSSDNSGMMGPSIPRGDRDRDHDHHHHHDHDHHHHHDRDGPSRMCYDAANSYKLGWYDNRREDIDPRDDNWGGSLVGSVDSGDALSSRRVVLRIIARETEMDLFVMFNRADGYNADAVDYADTVTVVRGVTADDRDGEVRTLAGLDDGATATFTDFDGTGDTLSVEVCDISRNDGGIFEARVVINLNGNGRARGTCGGGGGGGNNKEAVTNTSPENGTGGTTGMRAACYDSLTERAVFDGASWTCERLALRTRKFPRRRRRWCTSSRSNAMRVCRRTCGEYGATCTGVRGAADAGADANAKVGKGSTPVSANAAAAAGPARQKEEELEDSPTEWISLTKSDGTTEVWMCHFLTRVETVTPGTIEEWCTSPTSDAARYCRKTCGEWVPP